MQQSWEIYSCTMSHYYQMSHHYQTIANAMVNDPSFNRIDELKWNHIINPGINR